MRRLDADELDAHEFSEGGTDHLIVVDSPNQCTVGQSMKAGLTMASAWAIKVRRADGRFDLQSLRSLRSSTGSRSLPAFKIKAEVANAVLSAQNNHKRRLPKSAK
jgi:hypothetical protein